MFGGGVGDLARGWQETGYRSGVDDVSRALADHHGIYRLDAVGYATEIDVEQFVPVARFVRVGFSADDDARVVEEVIYAAPAGNRRLDHALQRCEVPHVEVHRDGVTASCADGCGDTPGQLELAIGDDDSRAR